MHKTVKFETNKSSPLEIDNYNSLPLNKLKFEDLEKYGKDRQKLLYKIEDELSRIDESNRENPHVEMAKTLNLDSLSDSTKDKLSHWLLRLVHAKNKDQFVNLEGHLYKVRLEKLSQDLSGDTQRKAVFHILENYYSAVNYPLEEHYDESSNRYFISIPFEDAVSLMASHKVIVRGGFANVESRHYTYLIRLLFARNLKEEMLSLDSEIDNIVKRDERLKKLVEDLPKMNYGKDYSKVEYSGRKGSISLHDIYPMAEHHFPLCMQEMHKELINKHHMRHYGRLQYGAFLKGAGVKVEDAVQFFKREFSKGNPKKVAEYTYYIEHLYGLKGKKTNYTPWACNKLISQNQPNAGEVHGCPFAHYGEPSLKQSLRQKFNPEQIEEIFSALNNPKTGKPKNPNDACKKHFMLLHPNAKFVDSVGRHPNAYLDASLKYKEFQKKLADRPEKAAGGAMDEEKPPTSFNNITEKVN